MSLMNGLKRIAGIASIMALTPMAHADWSPSPNPTPQAQRPQRPPGRPAVPPVKYTVRVTKAPSLTVHVDNTTRSRVVTTVRQGTLLDVRGTDSKGNWLRVTPRGKTTPNGWVPKSHTIRVRQ